MQNVYDIYPITIEDSLKASEVRSRFYISYWDSLIVASALNNSCNILYSEDMQHNQIIEGLKIINPFKESE